MLETEFTDQEVIGLVATVQYGRKTEYLIGVTNNRGRELQTNSVLLWDAILHAKSSGASIFDVGGLAANTPKGIAHYKSGLNPIPSKVVGEYWTWL